MSDRPAPPSPSLADRLEAIAREQREFLRDGQAALAAFGAVSQIDMLLLAAAKRSVALAEGFPAMIRARNFHAAAPMIRMQLDTALRVAALRFVSDPHAYAEAVMGGAEVFRLKDDTGARLNDHRLLERLAETFPWIQGVYRDASAFVHLSARHLWTSIATTDEDSRTVRFVLGPEDPPRVSDGHYIEAVDAFYRCLLLAKGLVLGGLHRGSAADAA
ncbi:hypothetical protein D9601_17145 [Sphingomonas sp. MA1305]|jgi:hypothetical protein|uniref:hypothetical protein n=1 Tax=Sphingomonas sp. MA1305 TaxID=2479204 RepID=UPI0018DF5AC5|nr:hypothetical protein [Sphingomonas sp. MA1305]MBI0477076.1 hypothetical protein [Sphingomonas sp. MA1305]